MPACGGSCSSLCHVSCLTRPAPALKRMTCVSTGFRPKPCEAWNAGTTCKDMPRYVFAVPGEAPCLAIRKRDPRVDCGRSGYVPRVINVARRQGHCRCKDGAAACCPHAYSCVLDVMRCWPRMSIAPWHLGGPLPAWWAVDVFVGAQSSPRAIRHAMRLAQVARRASWS